MPFAIARCCSSCVVHGFAGVQLMSSAASLFPSFGSREADEWIVTQRVHVND
jgi:hypothetical protein